MDKKEKLKIKKMILNGYDLPTATDTVINTPEKAEKIERVIDAGRKTPGEFIDEINDAIEQYNTNNGYTMEWWRDKGKPQLWRALCAYVGDTVFYDTKPLREPPTDRYPNVNVIANHNAYDVDMLNPIYDYYIRLCASVGLPCKLGDFALFMHIEHKILKDIRARLTPESSEFIEKALEEQGESIAASAEGSRIQPVIALARLNAFHGWERRSEITHRGGNNRRSSEEIAAEMGVDTLPGN